MEFTNSNKLGIQILELVVCECSKATMSLTLWMLQMRHRTMWHARFCHALSSPQKQNVCNRSTWHGTQRCLCIWGALNTADVEQNQVKCWFLQCFEFRTTAKQFATQWGGMVFSDGNAIRLQLMHSSTGKTTKSMLQSISVALRLPEKQNVCNTINCDVIRTAKCLQHSKG